MNRNNTQQEYPDRGIDVLSIPGSHRTLMGCFLGIWELARCAACKVVSTIVYSSNEKALELGCGFQYENTRAVVP